MKTTLKIIGWVLSLVLLVGYGYLFFGLWDNYEKYKFLLAIVSGIGWIFLGALFFISLVAKDKIFPALNEFFKNLR